MGSQLFAFDPTGDLVPSACVYVCVCVYECGVCVHMSTCANVRKYLSAYSVYYCSLQEVTYLDPQDGGCSHSHPIFVFDHTS